MRFVRTRRPPRTEDPLRPGVDRWPSTRRRPRESPGSGLRPCRRSRSRSAAGEPTCCRAARAFGILRRARASTHASFNGTNPSPAAFEQRRLRLRVARRRVGDQLGLARRQPSFSYRGGRRGQRSNRFVVVITRRASLVSAPTAFARKCAASRAPLAACADVSSTRFAARPSIPSVNRRITPNSRDHTHRLLTRQRARLEPGSEPLERRPRSRECVEHQRQSTNEV